MTTKINGTTGIEFPDTSVQASAADAGPAFQAAMTAGTLTGSLLLQAGETADPSGAYSAGRFTPQVAGYYQVNVSGLWTASGGTIVYAGFEVRKNAASAAHNVSPPISATTGYCAVSALIFLNGTTDFIEVWQTLAATGTLAINMQSSAFLARRAAP